MSGRPRDPRVGLYGRLAARVGVVPDGTRLGLLAATYAGYPVWAFRIARALETQDAAATPSVTA